MREDPAAMMLVRADLCERLAILRSYSTRAANGEVVGKVSAMRGLAAAYGLEPVARLAEALERAMARENSMRGAASQRTLYFDRLQDAIGCGRLDEQASEALLASVSVRLGA